MGSTHAASRGERLEKVSRPRQRIIRQQAEQNELFVALAISDTLTV